MAIPTTVSKVSVVIPTFNRAGLLRTAVESVLAQTYPALEVIVVDDGSTDQTEAMMQAYVGRVMYLRQANAGVSAARNRGLAAASGHYVNFLDDDDYFLPTKIESQVRCFEAHPQVGLVHCRYRFVDEAGDLLDTMGPLPQREVLRRLVCGCFIWSGAPLLRRECLERLGGFDEHTWSACEEWDLWLRVAGAYPVACVQEVLGAYRVAATGRMMESLSRLEHGVLATIDRVFATPELPPDVVTVKSLAYSNNYIEQSCRYYVAGMWDEAQRCLSAAVAARPALRAHPEDLLEQVYFGAMDVRTADPRVFAQSILEHMPPPLAFVAAQRDDFIQRVNVGVALRNYALNRVELAKLQLKEAWVEPAQPQMSPAFLDQLRAAALGPYIDQAVDFVARVFNHLPETVPDCRAQQPYLLSQVYLGLSLHSYERGDLAKAQQQVSQALDVYRGGAPQAAYFAAQLADFAMNQAISAPGQLVALVFDNLPASAVAWRQLRAKTLSIVNIACAFEDFRAERRRAVVGSVVRELLRRPGWISNRGVMSILLRSLPSLWPTQQPAGASG